MEKPVVILLLLLAVSVAVGVYQYNKLSVQLSAANGRMVEMQADVDYLRQYNKLFIAVVDQWTKDNKAVAEQTQKAQEGLNNELQTNEAFRAWSSAVLPVLDLDKLLYGSKDTVQIPANGGASVPAERN